MDTLEGGNNLYRILTLIDFVLNNICNDPLQLARMGKDGLQYLHIAQQADVLHGDIKFANILYYNKTDESFGLKVCDFGFAVALSSSEIPLTEILYTVATEILGKVKTPQDRAKMDMLCMAYVLFSLVTWRYGDKVPVYLNERLQFLQKNFTQEYADFFSLALVPDLNKIPTPERALELWDKVIEPHR